MVARYAWVLNLDADLELGACARVAHAQGLSGLRPPRGAGYAPTASVARATAAFAERVRASLLGDGDVVVDASSREGSARGLVGRAFCPTPRAIATLVRAGADPEDHPPFDVLRRVASRAFSAALGATMPKSAFVGSMHDARAILAGDPSPGSGWRIKRAFGMAGRGHRVVGGPRSRRPASGASGDTLRDADVAFLASWVEEGGVQIEPNVRVVAEWARHGRVAKDGSHVLGELTRQRTDASGAWLGSERDRDAPPEVRDAIARETERAARALAEAGYFGPFGVDAFAYEDDGRVVLRARSEINARYTMGFAVGFGT